MRLISDDEGCTIELEGARRFLSWTWLRDHARDDGSFLASAQQRIVSAATVASAGPATAWIEGSSLMVAWAGGPTAEFPADLLREFLCSSERPETVTAAPWAGAELGDRLTRIVAADFLTDDDALRVALCAIARDGIVVVDDVPTDSSSTRAVLERIGYVRSTIFGDVWEYRADGGFDDTASTTLEITPHTDGTYSQDAPGLLALHCHEYEATGADNVFVDGMTLAHHLATTSPDLHDVLTTVGVTGRYVGDGAHLESTRPPLRYDDRGRFVQISYNHHDRAPMLLDEPLMSHVFEALFTLDASANDPAFQFELGLRPGEMVLFDNWRLLHGRRAFEGARAIAGGYLNREDVLSRARLLGIR